MTCINFPFLQLLFRLIVSVEVLHVIPFKVSYDIDVKKPTTNLVYGKFRLIIKFCLYLSIILD